MDGYANLEAAVSSQSGLVLQQLVRAHRRKAVFSFLNNRSHHVLAPVLEGLRVILGNSSKGPLCSEYKVEAFWITSCVAIQIPAMKNNEEADKLRMVLETGLRQNVVGRASITDIRVIHDMFSPHMRLHSSPLSSSFSTASAPSSFQDNQWNIAKVRAPDVWPTTTGEGVVVATIDGGVNFQHDALVANYRGTVDAKNSVFNHSYNWFDYAYGSKYPDDDDGHGTNVQGILSARYGYGVAPGAQWISAKAYNFAGYAKTSWLLGASQFIMCPTNLDGTNPDCSLGADVVSCSWGFDSATKDSLEKVIDAWVAAGMIPVFAVGNAGPKCGTVVAPADYAGVIGVGGTDSTDALIAFSSRGPGAEGTAFNNYSPAVVAPGLNIQGPDYKSNSGYTGFSGTSQACPHVAGVAALMLSQDKSLNGSLQVLQRMTALGAIVTNVPEPASAPFSCNGTAWNHFPNFLLGYGRIDAYGAVFGNKTKKD